MIDIDNFKNNNDNFGHATGDLVLHEFGNLLIRNIREEDIACRYGGDEFIVVLPDTSTQVTCERADQIIVLAKQLQLQSSGNDFCGISISIGISFFPENGLSKAEILNAADNALFRAKKENRGKLIVSIPR